MNTVVYIGIDVHKDTYALSSFLFSTNSIFGQSTIASKSELVKKYVTRIQKEYPDFDVLCGYEAGPTGYGLYRDLERYGIPCVIMAPTTLPKASGDRVKNDRLDSQYLSKQLAFGTYSAVHVPTATDAAVKNFTRLRNTRKTALKKAKQNLLSFLLLVGRAYPESGSYWTLKHYAWLRKQEFRVPVEQETFNEYLQEVFDQQEKVDRYDAKIEEIAAQDEYRKQVTKLRCFRGIDTHTALSLITEISDFNRFASAQQFSSFLGLVPSEDSSGKRERRGTITKAGNSRIRLLLVEAANSTLRSSMYGKKSKRLLARQNGHEADVIAYADRANRRLHKVYNHLVSRGVLSNKAKIAAARELSCFVWGMMTSNIEGRIVKATKQ
ncbi:MAG: IS110 family transposase [Spirochaetia bacterium]|nr:IS110 family transposase [Spirochaetia bacterium]